MFFISVTSPCPVLQLDNSILSLASHPMNHSLLAVIPLKQLTELYNALHWSKPRSLQLE